MNGKISQRCTVPSRFHAHHGTNIVFENQFQTAVRHSSFANALTFSERPLAPGEIFLIEIEDVETGWSGHMRIGLTQMDPNTGFELPLYALPDLVSLGPCWLYAITKTHNHLYDLEEGADGGGTSTEALQNQPSTSSGASTLDAYEHMEASLQADLSALLQASSLSTELSNRLSTELRIDESVFENNPAVGAPEVEAIAAEENSSSSGDLENAENSTLSQYSRLHYRGQRNQVLVRNGDYTWTPCGFVKTKNLAKHQFASNLLATDIGSRIGVMYIPTGPNEANMHFIINGIDQGPCSRGIPYKDGNIYAVVDVYGSTKRVSTVQLYGVVSLQSICREVILQSIQNSGVSNLPLPNLLKNYLLFQERTTQAHTPPDLYFPK